MALGPGPHRISLNRCCCPEEVLEGCLAGVCFVTVEFRGVENARIASDPATESPPLLSFQFNPPSNPNPPPGAFLGPEIDYHSVVCDECEDWNRQWQLFLVQGEDFGTGGDTFVFALGQARSDPNRGYTLEPGVYDVPGAGDVCFPCAEVNDNTGLRLELLCVDDTRVTAELGLTINGCAIATWEWDAYVPEPINRALNRGQPKAADRITTFDWVPHFAQECYTPQGICIDPTLAYPCPSPSQIARFYDKRNCYWRNEPEAFEPGGTGPCIQEDRRVVTTDFAPIPDVGDADLVVSPSARDEDAWRLTATGAGAGGVRETLGPCSTAPQIDPAEVCVYDVFFRWGFNDAPPSQPGSVLVVTTDPGSGPGATLQTGVGGTPALPHNPIEYDNPAVTTHEIGGFRYRRLGRIQVACDATLRIEVAGPADVGTRMRFDEVVLRRSPTSVLPEELKFTPLLRFYDCESPLLGKDKNPTDCDKCPTADIQFKSTQFSAQPSGSTPTYIKPYDDPLGNNDQARDNDVWRLPHDVPANVVRLPDGWRATDFPHGSLEFPLTATPETVCTYQLLVRLGNTTQAGFSDLEIVIWTMEDGSGPLVNRLFTSDPKLGADAGLDRLTSVTSGGFRYATAGTNTIEFSYDAKIQIEVFGIRGGDTAQSIDFDDLVLRRL